MPPKPKYYIGRLIFGTPYFYPWNFNSDIISLRRLKERSIEEATDLNKKWPHLQTSPQHKFSNLPIVRRAEDWIFKFRRHYYWLQIGWPIYIYWHGLGWKDKFNSPRHEWNPSFYIFFFRWQFVINWTSPDEDDNDKYYEMILWYLQYSNKDIKVAEETWPWTSFDSNKSTWDSKYLL